MKNKTTAVIATMAILTVLFSSIWLAYSVPANPALLDPKTIPK